MVQMCWEVILQAESWEKLRIILGWVNTEEFAKWIARGPLSGKKDIKDGCLHLVSSSAIKLLKGLIGKGFPDW